MSGQDDKATAVADRLTKELIDHGKLIEAGWYSLRITAISPTASPVQLAEMRMAFFAGAQHIWGSVMTMLDAGDAVTPNDMRRMESIQKEMDKYAEELKARVAKAARS